MERERRPIHESLILRILNTIDSQGYFKTKVDQSPKYESLEIEAGEMIRRGNNLGIDIGKIFKIANVYMDNMEQRNERKK